MTLPFTLQEIIDSIGIHPLKVKNVYIYGSRVYSTAREGSDYDIILIGSNLLAHEEKRVTINGALLNIHIITPDKFLSDLKIHNMMNLECLFAPDWARLQEKQQLPIEINTKKLVKNILAQSYSSWQGGKMKLQNYDIYRGQKSIFHALRMLMFANQIAEYGKIVDFSEANSLFEEIMALDEIDWDFYKEKYLPLKIELEEKLKSFIKVE